MVSIVQSPTVIEVNTPVGMPPPLDGPQLSVMPKTILSAMRLGFKVGGALAPHWTSKRAHNIYFSPQKTPIATWEKKLLAKGRQVTISNLVGEKQIVWCFGKGPAILLVHGWESRGSLMARSFVEPLTQAGFKVVVFDMPAHGQSSKKTTDVMQFAQAIDAVSQAVGPIYGVIAHSLGAAAASISQYNGLKVEKVVYLSPVCWMLSLPERFCHILGIHAKLKQEFFARLFETFSEDDWKKYSGEALSKRLSAPCLLIHDKLDREIHHEGALAIHQAHPNSKLMLTEGLGHRRILTGKSVIKHCVLFISE